MVLLLVLVVVLVLGTDGRFVGGGAGGGAGLQALELLPGELVRHLPGGWGAGPGSAQGAAAARSEYGSFRKCTADCSGSSFSRVRSLWRRIAAAVQMIRAAPQLQAGLRGARFSCAHTVSHTALSFGGAERTNRMNWMG